MSTYRVIRRSTPPMLGDRLSPFAVSIGGDYYHVEPRYPSLERAGELDRGDVLVASGINGDTWSTMLTKAPSDAPSILLASVLRSADGSPLRNGAVTREAALAKERADPASVSRVLIPMAQKRGGDVVDIEMLPPHHWM